MTSQSSTVGLSPQGRVSRVVRILLAARDMRQMDLAEQLGQSASKVTRALAGERQWTIDDLEAMARIFDVPPSTFFLDPAEVIRTGSFSPLGLATAT